MKRHWFLSLFIVVVMLISVVGPILACPPPPPCPGGKCYADAWSIVDVEVSLPESVPQGGAYDGYIIATVVGVAEAGAKGPAGKAVATSYFDGLLMVFEDGNYYDGDLVAVGDADWDQGVKPHANAGGFEVLQIVIPVSGVASYDTNQLITYGYIANSIAEAMAKYKGKGKNAYCWSWSWDEVCGRWVIQVHHHMAWKHLAERKIVFHANSSYLLEFYEIGQTPGDGKYGPRDLVIDPAVSLTTEYFCSRIGGGCAIWSWTEAAGWMWVADVVPSTKEGADVHLYLDLPDGAPEGAFPSYGDFVDYNGNAVTVNPEWSMAHGAPM